MIWRWFRRETTLADRFVAAARAIDPAIDVQAVSDTSVCLESPDGTTVNCSLDSLAGEIRLKPHEAGPLLDHYARSTLANLVPLPAEVDAANVFPLLKPRGWTAGVESGPERPLSCPVTESIDALFVEAFPLRLRFVAERHLGAAIADVASLRAHAERNLGALAAHIEIVRMDDAPFWFAVLGDRYNFNASLALLPYAWRAAERAVGSPVVCAVPERESCLFAAADDAAAVTELRETLGPRLRANGGYPVSAALLRFDGTHLSEVVS